MGSSCKYSYLSGACANKHVDSLQCVGEAGCEFAGLNVLTSKKSGHKADGSGMAKWLGLYCETHRRFHFPGGEDCMCMGGSTDPRQARQPRVPDIGREP